MDRRADFSLERRGGAVVLALQGDWTALGLGQVGERLASAVAGAPSLDLDISGLGRLDSAGAYVLARTGGVDPGAAGLSARPEVGRLMRFVSLALHSSRSPAGPQLNPALAVLTRIGRSAAHLGHELFHTFVFYGRLLAALGDIVRHPHRIRVAPTVSLMERAGLDALPIIAVTTFFVGATLGYLGAEMLQQFGAQIYSVELIGIGMLREFAVLVTAIILAGRSASSFAAELGAMKMNQEIDAMQVMGVDAFEALVIPRFVAMLAMTPLLTFVAMVSGLFGGLVVIWAVVGLSPAFFLQRLLDNVGIAHAWVGLAKAPVMAVVIAAIGCRQGMEVGGDVEQLGRRVTTAVVQALFAIIVIDAVFAMLFSGVGL